MAIDIAGANTYFGATVHIRSEAWTRIPQARRIAALAHATCLIESRLEDDLETDATVAGDFPRHDAAVYEQALWMLQALDDNAQDKLERSQRIAKGQWTTKLADIGLNAISFEAFRHLIINPRAVRLEKG